MRRYLLTCTGDVTFNVPFVGTGVWTELIGGPTGVKADWAAWCVISGILTHVYNTHAYTHARTHAHPHACTHAHVYVCTHARMHMHVRMHDARTHARMHAHAHTCTQYDTIQHPDQAILAPADTTRRTVPSLLGPQVGGYVKRYNGLSYITVRDAGHMVPQYQPQAAFVLLQKYLAGEF